MDYVEVFKALANETRLNILLWLKEPEANFGPQGIHFSEPIDGFKLPQYDAARGSVAVGAPRQVDLLPPK